MHIAWTEERLFFDGDGYFNALLAAIDGARESVVLETYIYYPDEMGRWLEQHLIAAARRGVRVRVVVDGIGANSWIQNWDPKLERSGVQVKVWSPVFVGPFLMGIARGLLRKRGVSRLLSQTNRRTHRKYCVIDGRTAFVGSFNIARQHLPKFHGPGAWRDTGLRLEGSQVAHISHAFDHAWDRGYTPAGKRRWFGRRRLPRLHADSLVRLNLTRAYRRRFWRDLLARLRGAERRVWITNPYLAPTHSLLKALTRARQRGVDVRILVPARSDVFFMRWVATSYYWALLAGGVRVFEYQPSFLHAKSVIIDDWAMVGTSNMNTRSFLHDLEIDIVLAGERAKTDLAERFETDLAAAREITPRDRRGRMLSSRLGRLFLYVLRSWL